VPLLFPHPDLRPGLRVRHCPKATRSSPGPSFTSVDLRTLFPCILLVNFQGCLRCQLESSEMRSDSFEPGGGAGKAIMVCMGRLAQTYKFGNGDHDGPLFGCVRRLSNLELYPIGRAKMDKIPKSYDRGLLYPQLICQLQ
jgi:hypothetical protein